MSLDPISELLSPVLEKLGVARPDTAARLMAEWSDIAGEPWASQGRPAGLRRGELIVEVGEAATLSILRYRTGELLERLDAALGVDEVEVIRLRIARTAR